MVEQCPLKALVLGSSPSGPTNILNNQARSSSWSRTSDSHSEDHGFESRPRYQSEQRANASREAGICVDFSSTIDSVTVCLMLNFKI